MSVAPVRPNGPIQERPEPIRNGSKPMAKIYVVQPMPVQLAETRVKPEVQTTGSSDNKPEEKSSIQKKNLPNPEEKASGGNKNKKGRKFNGGGGRIHTEAQIDQILDWYLETGELPDYVSERQRHSYKHHIRLPERRELLDKQQTGSGNKASGNHTAGRYKNNITSLPRTGTHHS